MLSLGELEPGDESDPPSGAACASASASARPKRVVRPAERGDASSDASDGARTPTEQQGAAKKKRKYRKATHTVRKEEKAKLLKQMAVLHSRMEDIKARALRLSEEEEKEEPDERQKLAANRVLRRAIQSQQVDLAHVHGLMSEYFLFDTQAGSPIHRFIHLKRDKNERYNVLAGMKSSVLSSAERFVRSRLPRLDPLKPMREEHSFETPSGDYCSSYAAVTQLESAISVRHVFDTVLSFLCTIELGVSERLGSATIREEDDQQGSGLAQNWLVSSSSPSRLPIESNSILFSHCEDDSGVIVSDYVDQDELYPYRPHLRARRDVSACIHLATHSRPKSGADDDEQQTETVVVLTRWVNLRLHYPNYSVTSSGWRELREHSERWLRTLQLALHEADFAQPKPMSNF